MSGYDRDDPKHPDYFDRLTEEAEIHEQPC